MDKYLKMADVFKFGVSDAGIKVRQNYIVENIDDSFKPMEYAAHAINSHDELVAEVDRLHQVMQRCCDALYIADKFCGNHTADECDDSIAIPIKDALVEVAKELAK